MRQRHRAVALAALCIALQQLLPVAPATARRAASDVVSSTRRGDTAAPRAPGGPPLSAAGLAGASEEAGTAAQPEGLAQDPLVGNGLGSPLCSGALGADELSSGQRERCRTSGFLAASAPAGGFGLDVHIDTGFLGLSSSTLLIAVQDLVIAPLWMLVLWCVHTLVAMLEWGFGLDLLDSPATGGLGASLRAMEGALTVPWLAAVLSAAAVAAAYNGIVRRRVADTLSQALTMLAMTVTGLWVIADPRGTIGALAEWSTQASAGALAAASEGSPARPGRALADGIEGLFAATVEAPWCYLEFGDVAWCRTPARLDPRLRAAGLAIAAREAAGGACQTPAAAGCSGHAADEARSAQLLRSAETNGALFLALPANGAARNSINDGGSLLRTLCQSADATSCRGPTAAEAEFRTAGGTWPRLGGLLLIIAGVLGMLLLLGHIALRLLTAALVTLLLLLLAPAIVLAPALGESGRTLFRRWLEQLLASVATKLIFAFLLGVVLALDGVLSSLTGLGWWTQWLLTSASWWTVFLRRHQAFGLAAAPLGRTERPHGASPAAALRRLRRGASTSELSRRVERRHRERATAPDVLPQVGGEQDAFASAARGRVGEARGGAGSARADARWELAARPAGDRGPSLAAEDRQAALMLAGEHAEVRANGSARPALVEHMRSGEDRLRRVLAEQRRAREQGLRRRELRLGLRAERLRGELAGYRSALDPSAGAPARARSEGDGRAHELASFLDAQSALPGARSGAGERPAGGARRDYAALAPLAGYGSGDYARLAPRERREARLEIDRQLELRRHARGIAGDGSAASGPPPQPSVAAVLHDVREVRAGRKREPGWGRE